MNDDRVAGLLQSLHEGQQRQLAIQEQALRLQREQFELVKRQTERTERLQDRAEQLQARSAQVVGAARKSVLLILPIVTGLIAYLSWLLFR